MASKVVRAIAGDISFPKSHGKSLPPSKLKNMPSVAALDIEADAQTGEPYLLSYSTPNQTGLHPLRNSTDVIDILSHMRFRETLNFFYNLQYDIEGMLRFFPQHIGLLLYGNGKAKVDARLKEANDDWKYKIGYLAPKAFHIATASKHKYSYYDLLQYFNMGLRKALEKYVDGVSKLDFNAKFSSIDLYRQQTSLDQYAQTLSTIPEKITDKDGKKIEVSPRDQFYTMLEELEIDDTIKYQEVVDKYAKVDSYGTRLLGEQLVSGVSKFMITKRFHSTASLSEEFFRRKGLMLPNLTLKYYRAFMRSYYGGRFEITKRGLIPNVSMYDIKSAYPYAMSKMPILTDSAMFRNVKQMDLDALYGSYCISVDIPDDMYLSPLPYRGNVLYYPTRLLSRYWVDKLTIQLLEELQIPYRIWEGVEVYDRNANYSLGDSIKELYAIKDDKRNPEFERYVAKIFLNSLYGKFIQLTDDTILQLVIDLEEMDSTNSSDLFEIEDMLYKRVHTETFNAGKLFAPYYASYITSHCRKQIFDAARQVGWNKVAGIHTDSLILQGASLETGRNLGDWELEMLKSKDKVIPMQGAEIELIKCGFYRCKYGEVTKVRSRGIGKTDSILQESFDVTRRYGLSQAVRGDYERLNRIEPRKIDNNLNTDQKRDWDTELTLGMIGGGEWVDSRPKQLIAA